MLSRKLQFGEIERWYKDRLKVEKMKRKAQEEMMGFLIIVVIVVIIGLVFLAFSLRQKTKSVEQHKMQADDLLQAVLLYTTDCKKDYTLNVRELIRECNTNEGNCDDQTRMCEKLNETLGKLLDKALGTKIENAFIHGYSLEINSSRYLKIEKGNLTGNYFSSVVPIPVGYNAEAIVRLKLYHG
ncbi:MAG: hypothetical protein QXE93_00395 [Candidatus Pacearchaeota archaeon]